VLRYRRGQRPTGSRAGAEDGEGTREHDAGRGDDASGGGQAGQRTGTGSGGGFSADSGRRRWARTASLARAGRHQGEVVSNRSGWNQKPGKLGLGWLAAMGIGVPHQSANEHAVDSCEVESAVQFAISSLGEQLRRCAISDRVGGLADSGPDAYPPDTC